MKYLHRYIYAHKVINQVISNTPIVLENKKKYLVSFRLFYTQTSLETLSFNVVLHHIETSLLIYRAHRLVSI